MHRHSFVFLAVCLGVAVVGCTRSSSADYADEMHEQHADDAPVASEGVAGADTLDVRGQSVTYASAGGASFTGFLAIPDDTEGPLPGIIVVHEWWGLNDNIKQTARKLAAEGYQVLAVDLYGGDVAEQPDAARAIMQAALEDPDELDENLRAAHAYLTIERDAPGVGVIGWCFGGYWSLHAALAMPAEIDAMVMYYGRPVLDDGQLGTLDMPVLAFFGEEDTSIPLDSVAAFDSLLDASGVDNEVNVVPNAGHAFANPSGENYVPKAAEEAWEKTLAFFEENLR